jgi:hypothetical protein
MIELSPGVRRLCVCVDAPQRRLLESACRIAGFGRLYTEYLGNEGTEVGFASPGVDEAALVTDLITALRIAATEAAEADGIKECPALAAFHVGITRVEGNAVRGAAVIRALELIRELGLKATPDSLSQELLVVGISAGLFDDIGAECGFTDGWARHTRARAWIRGYGADQAVIRARSEPGHRPARPDLGRRPGRPTRSAGY